MKAQVTLVEFQFGSYAKVNGQWQWTDGGVVSINPAFVTAVTEGHAYGTDSPRQAVIHVLGASGWTMQPALSYPVRNSYTAVMNKLRGFDSR